MTAIRARANAQSKSSDHQSGHAGIHWNRRDHRWFVDYRDGEGRRRRSSLPVPRGADPMAFVGLAVARQRALVESVKPIMAEEGDDDVPPPTAEVEVAPQPARPLVVPPPDLVPAGPSVADALASVMRASEALAQAQRDLRLAIRSLTGSGQ